MTDVAQISHLVPRLRRLAWLPVPFYITVIAILYITLPRELMTSLVFDPPGLMLVSNTVFFFAISYAVFTAAMRAYLASGSSNILLLGCGVLALGGAALAGGWVRPLGGEVNTSVTIHNLGVLLGAILHAVGGLFTLLKAKPEQRAERRRLKLFSGLVGTLTVLIAIAIVVALGGIVPLFWAADVGSTPTMHTVLGIAALLFALTSIYTMVLYSQTRRYFLWWYSLGLALTCVGLVGINVMKAVGSPIGWAGRTAQYLGGAYFFIAALSALREAHRKGWSLEAAISNFYHQSDANYRTLVEAVGDAIISIDDRNRVLVWNPGAERILGYTPGEALGRVVSDLLMPEGQEERLDHELQNLQTGSMDPFAAKQLEIEMRRKDGTFFPSDTSFSMRRIGSGWIATLLVRDITERKRIEEALRESEGKYRTLVEQSLQGTWVIQDMHVVFCNQTFANMGGWTIPEVLSWSPEQVINVIHPDDQKRVWGRFRERLEGKQLPLTNNQLQAFRKDGSIAWIEYDARRINLGGRPAMLISVLDITKRREAEKALRESEQCYRQLSEENARLLEQARQDAQTKTILLHEVNHRVKNNLASIIGLIQTHGRFRKKKGSPEVQSICNGLAGRVQGLAMAHNLLSAAGWSSVKLTDLATEVIHSTLQILPSDQRASLHVSPSSTQVTPDQANTLALVINELATNTIKHGQTEKQDPSISVRIEEKDGQILFEFRDNGPGYPEPILDGEQYDVGLHLVTNLVRRDLKGEVTFHNDHGAVTQMQFGNRGS